MIAKKGIRLLVVWELIFKMPNILILSENNIFKSDLIDQIEHHASEFDILSEEKENIDIIVIDENIKILEEYLKKDIKFLW